MSTSPVQIALTAEQQRQLAALCAQSGKLPSEVIGEALAAYRPVGTAPTVNPGESFFEAASRLGLIGCVPGGPADLSTNPKYMDGFGACES